MNYTETPIPYCQLNQEKSLSEETEFRLMEELFPEVTATTAAAAAQLIHNLHGAYPPPHTKELIEDWKMKLDEVAADTMARSLNRLPFLTNKVGSEGDKEIQYAGVAAASCKGFYGSGTHPEVWGVSDVVEGTTFAANNMPGASSVLAITEPHGIMPTPKDTNYMVKLIAPPQAKNILSLEQFSVKNLHRLCNTLSVEPQQLTQVTLNPSKKGREINQRYVDIGTAAGLTVKTIDAGDFMPSVRAALDPYQFKRQPIIVVGRGGFEEGLLAAAGVKACGGFMEARAFNTNPDIMAENPVWTIDDLIPGSKDKTLLCASFITSDPTWFHQPGVLREVDGSLAISTMIVTQNGVRFKSSRYPQ